MPYRGNRRRLATKKYVRHAIEEADWSEIQRTTLDLDEVVVNEDVGVVYILDNGIFDSASTNSLWTRISKGTDNVETYELEYRIKYIRIKLRVATGEDEVLSAISQTVRFCCYRTTATWSEIATSSAADFPMIQDVDAAPIYERLYGDINGIWMDKWVYVHSWAADQDTTAGGQAFIKKVIKPLHSNNYYFIPDAAVGLTNDTEKGCVAFQINGDDPSGANSQVYGFIEVGWVYKT